MSPVTVTDLNNAKLDCDTIGAAATSSAPTVTDRLGNTKNTLSGMNAAVLASAAAVQGSIGYLPPVAYAAGISLTLAAQTVGYSGQTYAPLLSALPFTTSGTFESAKFRLIQGVSGADLAASSGAGLVGYQAQNASAPSSTVQEKIRTLLKSGSNAMRPAYLEQFVTGFFGRGMLTAEANDLVTEQFLTGPASVGDSALAVTSATNFLAGACVTVKHDNGLYATYFVAAKAGNGLTIYPALRYSVSATSKVERTWFNRAHPGKFYMRQLAQRIARSTEQQAAMPSGPRVLYSGFVNNATKIEDQLVPVGGATVNYYAPSNTGAGGITDSVRFGLTQTAYATIATVGDGAETRLFRSETNCDCIASVVFSAGSTGPSFQIEVLSETNSVLRKYSIPNGGSQRVMQVYQVPFNARSAKFVKVRVSCAAAPSDVFYLGQIDVFEAPALQGRVIGKLGTVIVGFGDSWVAGDLTNTLQREPIMQQLALELPDATIINAGIGGNKIWEMVARFDTDVAVHQPDYVVINTGTNECYNPASGVFEPNSTDFFVAQYQVLIGKITAIGARPIIIGVPALAQSDEAVPAWAEWLLNDRARAYSRAFSEWLGASPLALGAKSGLEVYRTDALLTAGASPSVAYLRRVDLEYAAATTITDLLGGVSGQLLTLVARNGNATIAHGNILPNGAENVTLINGSTLTLMRLDSSYSGGWVEIGRSIVQGGGSSELTIVTGTSPSVAGARYINLNYAEATTVVDFTGGTTNQEIQVRAMNGNVTLTHSTFQLTGSVNVTLTTNSIVTLRRADPALSGAWYEVSRSIK